MREWFLACCFELFHLVVEEEVDQDGIDVGVGVQSFYFPAYQLDTPDTTSCFKLATEHIILRVMDSLPRS
jgi:hypothetical protein